MRREYYLAHREEIIAKNKIYRSERREHFKKYLREYYRKNKEILSSKMKIYRERNKEALKPAKRAYYDRNTILCKFRSRVSHANKAGGGMTVEKLQKVYECNIHKYGTLTCYLCLKKITFGKDSLDHKTPVSRGGDNSFDNLGIVHKKCNGIKHRRTYKEYLEYVKESK